jgi:hypothetical protein
MKECERYYFHIRVEHNLRTHAFAIFTGFLHSPRILIQLAGD